jgi:hypothetical protein
MAHVDESCYGSKQVKVSDYSQILGSSPTLGDTGSDSDRLYSRVTIGKLPDDVLLHIFVYVVGPQVDYYCAIDEPRHHEGGWRTLVHVCKRWRSVVLSSPLRLDLRLFCTNRRPVKKLLDIWPPLPIYIYADHPARKPPLRGVTNLVAALKQQNRVWGIWIEGVPNSLLKKSAAMNLKSFPALTRLVLQSTDQKAPVLPDSFLGGSAPRLQEIWLTGIPFPGIGKLLLSTTDLVKLSLWDIPHSGYISPEAIVDSLSTLTKLEVVGLRFRSPRSRANRENQHPSLLTRVILPALIEFYFSGDSEYLEDIVSIIDAPSLNNMDVTFFNQLVFDTPQLRHSMFISRAGRIKAPDCAHIFFDDGYVTVKPFQRLSLRISCKPSDWQLSSLSQLYNTALYPLPALEHLEIHNRQEYWDDDMENVQWLELLRQFPSLKDLVLSAKSFRLVAPALDELDGESVTEVLPVLQNIVLQAPRRSEPDHKAIEKFIATRQFLGSTVTVEHRDGYDPDFY